MAPMAPMAPMASHGGSDTEMGAPSEVTLLKLGGSLLTDKTAIDAVRPAVLARLAAEIAEIAESRALASGAAAAGIAPALVLAHGSGSFGHVAARRHGLAAGLRGAGQLPGVSLTQERAAALHWQVCGALAAAGLHPFSLAPSSSVVAAGGRPLAIAVEPLLLALARGLLPVLYGDIVLDRLQGVAICSTERLFELLASELPAHGVRVRRVVWLGETDGVYDAAGHILPRLDADDFVQRGELRGAIGGAAGTDVTGGMLHRVETALALAARGIPSLIANGTTPGLLAAALRGEPVPGTQIVVSSATPRLTGEV
jgi:isopentenyl phosphate kinase